MVFHSLVEGLCEPLYSSFLTALHFKHHFYCAIAHSFMIVETFLTAKQREQLKSLAEIFSIFLLHRRLYK